ncbi:MAG: chemotaxis protein CheD, partial [Dehalococcoidia bacterium]|nr:chemotaxis protein CheD [Dehalococcoidia bacterium]
CVAVCMHDPVAKVSGMLHVLLPTANGDTATPGKFADTGIPWMLATMTRAGADRARIVTKIAGGAAVLRIPGNDQAFNIGDRNTQAVRQTLNALGLPIAASDVGGTVGRTVQMDGISGRVAVRAVGQPARVL